MLYPKDLTMDSVAQVLDASSPDDILELIKALDTHAEEIEESQGDEPQDEELYDGLCLRYPEHMYTDADRTCGEHAKFLIDGERRNIVACCGNCPFYEPFEDAPDA